MKTDSNFDVAMGALSGCLAALLIALLMAMFTGWLVTIVVGYFGYHLTIWQGFVTAFTVSLVTGSTTVSKG